MGLTSGIPLPQQFSNAQTLQTQLAALPAPQIGPVDMNGGGGPPAIPAPSLMPSATMSRSTPSSPNSGDSQILRDNDRLNLLHSTGSGIDQIHNPLLRGVARGADIAAQIAGSVFSPIRVADALIPGTNLHHNLLVNQAQQNLANDQATAQQQAQTENLNLQPQLKEQAAQLAEDKLNNTEQHQQAVLNQQRQLQLARNGQMEVTGPDGQTHIVDDPDSQIFQGRQTLADYHTAQTQLDQARAELAHAGNDPKSPAYQLALRKLQVSQANAAAAGERAQAYMGNYLKGAYNVGLHGDTLPGAPQIGDDNGNMTTVGATNAPQAVKANANAAQFGDVFGALGNAESAAHHLVQSGGQLNSPRVAAALAVPASQLESWLQGEGVKSGLTPEEREYVTSIAALHENVQALRKSAGGVATDSSIAKLDALVPGTSTPDLDYFLRQTGQIRQTASRLGRGVTTVKGGLSVPKEGGGAASPDYVFVPGKGLVKQ